MTGRLTAKQRKFAELYAKGGDLFASARGAGYAENFVTQRSSSVLLKNEKIIEEVKRLRSRLNERAEKSAVDVVNEYATIAFSDRVEFLKEDPDYPDQLCYKSPYELTPDQRKCVEKVHIHKRFTEPDANGKVAFIREEYSYTFITKESALNQMGRHFGIFDDKLRLSVSTNPFKNLPTEKLLKLKEAYAVIMSDGQKTPALIEGSIIEQK